MQFACESCQAQLQIADDKVRGRRLIVRCKRCGAKIALADPLLPKSGPRVVEPAPPRPAPRDTDTESTRAMDSEVLEKALRASRAEEGGANGSPPTQRFAAPPPPVPANPAVWFAMLQGKQTGPLTRDELGVRANEGAIGPRTYVWCEGMDSWQRAKEVLELTELFPPLPAPAPPALATQSGPSAAAQQAAPPRPQPRPAAQTPAPSAAQAAGAPEPAAAVRGPKPPAVPDLTPGDQARKSALELAGWATSELSPKKETPAAASSPAPPLVPRAPMFESAAPVHGRGPFIVFLALMALAAAAVVLWIVLGSAPQPPDPAPPGIGTVGLTADQVRRKLDENKPELQGCVDEALRRDPNLRVGKIHVATTIAPSGQVTAARIDRQNVDESPLGACLKQATRKIVFPQFSGAAFDVDIPISVSASE